MKVDQMHIVLLTHPEFFGSQSMPRFARMIESGMLHRGHTVEVWEPEPFFYKLPMPRGCKKWLGYLDQFIVFPFVFRRRLKAHSRRTIYVFTDQALGPWVKWFVHKPHVIHCHDLLALRSARNEFVENPTTITGKFYQKYILNGFRKGSSFICTSHSTASDLKRFLHHPAKIEVVYNGLNYAFSPMDTSKALRYIQGLHSRMNLERGYFLNVSGNQWYKNRSGILEAYRRYKNTSENPLPLIIAGAAFSSVHRDFIYKNNLSGMVLNYVRPTNEALRALYTLARALFFPSLEEGFGWPIVEAQACGTLVLTSDRPPMSEVGHDSVVYVPHRTALEEHEPWESKAAEALLAIENMDIDSYKDWVQRGFINAKRFEATVVMADYERIYEKILDATKF